MQGFISRQAAIDATSEIVFVEYEDTDPCKEEKIITQTKAAIRDRIKALPPVYVPDTNVGDMISKQVAMERLMAKNVIMDGSEYHNGFNAGVNRAQEVIRNLLPVQSDVPVINVGDMISRQAVIDLLKQMRKDGDMVPWEGKADANHPEIPDSWVPVTKKMPEDDGEYFVLYDEEYAEDYDTGRVGVADFYVDCEAFGYWQQRYDPVSLGFVDCDFTEIKVKKWMPIPKEE